MVRVFPVFTSGNGLSNGSSRLQAAMAGGADDNGSYASGDFNRIVAQFRLICRRAHASHPLGVFYGDNPLNYAFSLFLFELVLYVFVTRLVRFLLRPLRQPRIVSEILGGLIVGPSVLGRNNGFRQNIFPDNAQYVVKNVGLLGFMFFLFVSGIKMDLNLVSKIGRKHLFTAIFGVLFTFAPVALAGYFLRPKMDTELARVSGIGAVSSNLAISAFPVIHIILKEMNLLNSDVGRMALSTALVGDAIGIGAILVFEAIMQARGGSKSALWYVMSSLVMGIFVVVVVKRAMIWIAEKAPEGKPVNQTCVVFILLGSLVMGFLTDMLGIAVAVGPLWLGLVIPDGPPLGATLVERSETFVMDVIMPFAFMSVGLISDVDAMFRYGWTGFGPLFIMVMTGYFSKLLANFVAALYFHVPLRDSLTLCMIMNLRGQVDLLIFLHWIDKKIVGIPSFTMMVVILTVMTGIFTPLISILYDPDRPYMINKRRTIMHTPAGTELRIVICIHDEQNVASLINLLDISYPTLNSPFSVYALHLIELVGRAIPVFIDHDIRDNPCKYIDHDKILNALKLYQETREDVVKLQSFTAVAPKTTMYQDICELALVNKANLIILPYDRERLDNLAGTEIVRHVHGNQSLSSKVLAHAPCSVAILVAKGQPHNYIVGQSLQHSVHRYIMLFLGGADSREALTYADRMAVNPEVSLLVIRFLAHNQEGDNEKQKKLDDGVVTWFWVKNDANERVVYREVVVRNGEETMAAIQSFNDNSNDLWIVGRKRGVNPVLLQGLVNWNENRELGVVGDFLASPDFGSSASVLVVQKQILRG